MTLVAAFEDALKKTQHVRQVEPKPTINAFGIHPTRDSGVVPFNQHHALASQTFHERTKFDNQSIKIPTKSLWGVFIEKKFPLL